MRVTTIVLALLVIASSAAAQTTDDRLRALEREVAELRAAVGLARGDGLEELERRIDVLAAEIERLRAGQTMPEAEGGTLGLGPAASKVYRTDRGVSIGGYGEMLVESFDSRRDDGAASGRRDTADFLRAIVYVGYKFNEDLLLNTELEFEHGSTGKGGEVSVEFAYLDWRASDALGLRGGMVLLPVGLINELHEPTVFLSARRPGVEQAIIPTTWRENGLGIFGDLGPLSYRSYIVTGLDAARFSAAGLRSGRQSGARAKAESLAWVGRLDYTATPGLLLGASAYIGESGQGVRTDGGEELDVATRLLEVHADWRWRGVQARALAVRAELDDVAELNDVLGLAGAASVGETMEGAYLELGFDVLAARGGRAALTPFARVERYDTQAEVPAGFARNPASDVEVLTLGVAFKPIDQIAVKVDWQDVDNGAGTGIDQINLALGYVF